VKTSYLEGYQEFTILLKLRASSSVLPPVLGFYHLSESGITADVFGRHLTVETERNKNILKIYQYST
jgi:hypothetical protein